MIDYKKRYEEVANYESDNYFKPGSGLYCLKFLSEGREDQYEENGRITKQVVFNVLVTRAPEIDVAKKGKEYLWSVSEGKTLSSLYGQIMRHAVEVCESQLSGRDVTLNVIHDAVNNKNTYTVLPGSLA